jgi:hypothetical protein
MDGSQSGQDCDSLASAVEARDIRSPANSGEPAPTQTVPSNNLTLKADPCCSANHTDDLPAVQVPDFAAIVTPLKKRCAAWVNASIRQDKIFRRLLFEAARQVVPHARSYRVEFGAFCGPEITGTTEAKVVRLLFGEQNRANVRNWSYVLAWWADRPAERRDPAAVTLSEIVEEEAKRRGEIAKATVAKPERAQFDLIADQFAALSPEIVISPNVDERRAPESEIHEQIVVYVARVFAATGRYEFYRCAADPKLTKTGTRQARMAEVRAPRRATWDAPIGMPPTANQMPQPAEDEMPQIDKDPEFYPAAFPNHVSNARPRFPRTYELSVTWRSAARSSRIS